MSESFGSVSFCSENNGAIATPTSPIPVPKKTKRGPRGGVYDPFPMKVHRMLNQSKAEGNESIVSWLDHGRAFKIHKPKVFAEVIMPRFFNQSKYTSFQRQLNLYGFNRSTRGADTGSYYHELFLRGKPSLAARLLRQKVKGSGHKTLKLLDKEPDFYTMPPLIEDPQDSNPIPNVFPPDSRQYLPVTAVAPVLETAPEMAFRPMNSSPRTISSHSSSSFSENESEVEANRNPPTRTSYDRHVTLSPDPIVLNTSGSTHGDASFVNELNQTIFMHELAMGCSILCQLRRGDSNM